MKKTFLAAALLSAFSSVALANQAGDILVRGGVTLVNPDSDKSTVVVPALGGATPLSISVDDNAQLGLNLVYFFDSNWAVEVLAATPFTHDVTIHDPQGISEGLYLSLVFCRHSVDSWHRSMIGSTVNYYRVYTMVRRRFWLRTYDRV